MSVIRNSYSLFNDSALYEPLSNNEDDMAAKKRIYNPVTETYYEIRQRTTEYGQKGEIKGKWKKKK